MTNGLGDFTFWGSNLRHFPRPYFQQESFLSCEAGQSKNQWSTKCPWDDKQSSRSCLHDNKRKCKYNYNKNPMNSHSVDSVGLLKINCWDYYSLRSMSEMIIRFLFHIYPGNSHC